MGLRSTVFGFELAPAISTRSALQWIPSLRPPAASNRLHEANTSAADTEYFEFPESRLRGMW